MIWIIGCNGMLGTELSGLAKEQNLQYTATDRECDITDIEALREFSRGKNIEWIINCSAYTNVDKSEDEEDIAFRINASGAGNIAAVCSEINARMIHISTDYVFDGKGKTPYTEDLPVQPTGAYGRTKLAGEKLIQENCRKYFILRTAWLYGRFGNNFVHTMLRLFKERESLNVVSDQIGSPTWTRDLSGMILHIIKQDSTSFGIYHYSNEGEISWYDFACEIGKQAFLGGLIPREIQINPITSDKYPSKVKRPEYSVLSKEKIKKSLHIEIPEWKVSLSSFLKEFA